ncbi:MAG: thioredoxin family protein [Granulosicoccaceae bacterium]
MTTLRNRNSLLTLAIVIASVLTYSAITTAFVTAQANVPVGEDGLHKPDWLSISFRDVSEDIAEAAENSKRHIILFEQQGCIYCEKMHKTVLQDPEVVAYIKEHFVVIQYNLYGDEEVTDTDGDVLTEKTASEKWGINFTPTWMFMPEQLDGNSHAADAADGNMYGAFGKGTFLDMLTWINQNGFDSDEGFQRFHSRRISERQAAAGENASSVATD